MSVRFRVALLSLLLLPFFFSFKCSNEPTSPEPAPVVNTPQVHNPVKWSYSAKAGKEGEAELIIKATIEEGWHLYSQNAGEGPISTSFTFEKAPASYDLVGKTSEPKPHKVFDPNFGTDLQFFEKEVTFRQKIKLKKDGKFTVKGMLEFMVCNDKMCLPPETIDFSISGEGKMAGGIIPPKDTTEKTAVDGVGKDTQHVVIRDTAAKHVVKQNPKPIAVKQKPVRSNIEIFILGFLGGLVALLTPCVFPMLPLTVSFFTKQSKSKRKGVMNAMFYGFSIIMIYVGLGLLITISFGPDALNDLASNGLMNMIFFVLFVVFALSFLGAFEITLPSSWINKADNASEKGGLVGIFFMAFTLSLVSFSCTGPIIGTLLVDAAVGGQWLGPAIGMTGFSLALALPFGLFAAFPGWLNSLPKSGSWLNSVKVVLGLLELALALKFLSNVDLAYHWGFLKRELFLAIWIVIFSLLGFYLLGKIKFSHDSDTPHISIPRFLFALFSFAFVTYLVPGLWGAPLKMISGFPPPIYYNEGWSQGGAAASSQSIPGTDPSHCPHNLNCFHDYDLALAYAKESGKPLLVDFTGYSCVNCRKMEDNVWSDPRVLQRLREDYVLVSLYVDDKAMLPKEKQYLSPTTSKRIRTVGNKWSDFQTARFGTNSQPYYVLLDHNEEVLSEPSAYDPDITKYINFLDNGKKEFLNRKAEMSVSDTLSAH